MTSATFTQEPLTKILTFVRAQLAEGAARIELCVPDPDLSPGLYSGERIPGREPAMVHRSFRTWVDLAERLRLRLATPRPAAQEGMVQLSLTPLDPKARWEPPTSADPTEKYGERSDYQRISKLEDPGFVLDFADALDRMTLPDAPRVLDLGVNTGDELALLSTLRPDLGAATFVGIDHSSSAIARARERFYDPRHWFIEADLADLPRLELELDRFDLVICIGTLQSPGVDDRELLQHLVQRRLHPHGCLLLGFPNSSYLDGEVLYGAKMKNFTQPDLSLLIKNVSWYRRYLHKHRRKVFVTGKHHLLVTAVPEDASTSGRAAPSR